MRKAIILIGLLCAAVPSVADAQSASLFSRIFEESRQALPMVNPDGQMTQYVIGEMERWDRNGIKVTEDDIADAVKGDQASLCNGKVDMNDRPLEFGRGSDTSTAGSCIGLQRSILSLIRSEQEADQLGKDLLAIANGSELSVADEGSRPVNMGRIALLLRRVWSGTGAGVIPWDEAAATELDAVEAALSATNERDRAVMRFRHGYFRDRRERDATFHGVGDDVGDALRDLAGKLGITGDQTAVGEFAMPGLASVPDIAVWARKDDIGLMWVYPTRFAYPKVERAGTYPALVPNGDHLAYPFSYDGSSPDVSVLSPLCSRSVARNGYLCRAAPTDTPGCASPSDAAKISLVLCQKREKQTVSGPFVCDGLKNLYADDGTPLVDPSNPGRLNPALKNADVRKICEPGAKILYQDEITAHACYVSHCLLQSMSGHTLVPNRNTNLVNEATSPYLACMRPDPQLGLYAEVAEDSPYPLPDYIGHELVQEFEQNYCMQGGKTAHPVLGFCSYRQDARIRTPNVNQVIHYNDILEEGAAVTVNQNRYLSLATVIGQRVALRQANAIERKIFATLATLVRQTADLILELKRAPLTQSACPWTGPVISSSQGP